MVTDRWHMKNVGENLVSVSLVYYETHVKLPASIQLRRQCLYELIS
jgi:hypothetical protein